MRERARTLCVRRSPSSTTEILAETQRLAAQFQVDAPLERVALTPKRGQVAVHFVALGWIPADGGRPA